MKKTKVAGSLNKYGFSQADTVWSSDGISPTILAYNAGQMGHQINILAGGENEMGKRRIRKLTEGECYRLMGFEKKDTEACKAAGQSKATIFHEAGDSLVTTVMAGIFGELFGLDYEKAINDYADKLHEEVI